MNPKYVTSLELSRKLKELGVKQESIWTWVLDTNTNEYKLVIIGNRGFTDYICAGFNNKEVGEMFSAFLSGELGEIFGGIRIIFLNCVDGVSVWTNSFTKKLPKKHFHGKTLAEALGEFLAYLKENKLI